MATHNYVVRVAAGHFSEQGHDVWADIYKGSKPPTFEGPRGGRYKPDIWVRNIGTIVEVETYHSVRNSVPQIKSFAHDPKCKRLIVIICSGTPAGIPRIERFLEDADIDCEVWHYKDLPNWPHWIPGDKMRCQGRNSTDGKCSRNASEIVEGYAFCWQHARFAKDQFRQGNKGFMKQWVVGRSNE